ncbi:MAG: RNA polymerase sigma factor [Mucilaginibacter sp.]
MNNQYLDSKSIDLLISGDESAFTLVYELYSEKVYRLAFKFLKDREQSEEIVQETFINLWTSREKLNSSGNIWLYLFVIAKRLSLNALRQSARAVHLTDEVLHDLMQAHNGTEEEVLAHDLEQYTERIIQKLPRQQQLVFKLSRVDGLSHKEIAEQLHISQNTVKNHMVEALKTLKLNLKYSDLIFFVILSFWL